MLAQTFAAVWIWLKAKLPTYKRPVVEITANTTLDGTIHNGAILVCSQPVTLTPARQHGQRLLLRRGQPGAGNVTFGSGIITSSGSTSLLSGQAATVRVAATPAAQSSSPRWPEQRRWRLHAGNTWSGHRPEREQSDVEQRHAQLVGAKFRRCRQQLHRPVSRHGNHDLVYLRDRRHCHHCVGDRARCVNGI